MDEPRMTQESPVGDRPFACSRMIIAGGCARLRLIIIVQLFVSVLSIVAYLLTSPWDSPAPPWLVLTNYPIFLGLEAAACFAWFRITLDPGGGVRSKDRSRIRVCAVALLVLGFISSTVYAVSRFGIAEPLLPLVSSPIGLAGTAARICLYFFSMAYFAALAVEWDEFSLANRIDEQRWKLVLWITLGALIVIGPFVALIRYLRILDQLRLAASGDEAVDPRLIAR